MGECVSQRQKSLRFSMQTTIAWKNSRDSVNLGVTCAVFWPVQGFLHQVVKWWSWSCCCWDRKGEGDSGCPSKGMT